MSSQIRLFNVVGMEKVAPAALYLGKFPTFEVDERLQNYAFDALNI